MRALGAQVILTPASGKGTGMVAKAAELAAKHGWFQPRQFENPANAAYHAKTTGPEIVEDFKDIGLDYWVTGYGTGGTLQGVASVLRKDSPKTQIVLSEPSLAPLFNSGTGQTRNSDGSPAGTHPAFTPHPIQGWTPDFIPLLAEQAKDLSLFDQCLTVEPADAMATAHRLAREEGIFTGTSGGATMATALQVAATAPQGSTILAMLPDTGERYLSTPLLASIPADMSEEEVAISQSTPNFVLPPPTSA